MVADGLLTRQRYREVPPRVDYELTERARSLMPILGALGRWGFEWTWSGPRNGEDVDIGAILRLAPGMLTPAASLHGTVAIAATGKHAAPRDYVLTVADGRVAIAERAAPDADARVDGPHEAWIAALGPDHDFSGLRIEGDKALAGAVLDGLAAVTTRASSAAA